MDVNLHSQEKELSKALWNVIGREESIVHQRSRVQWLELGDQNTTYFHKRIANNLNTSKIPSLFNALGVLILGTEAIKSEAITYF